MDKKLLITGIEIREVWLEGGLYTLLLVDIFEYFFGGVSIEQYKRNLKAIYRCFIIYTIRARLECLTKPSDISHLPKFEIIILDFMIKLYCIIRIVQILLNDSLISTPNIIIGKYGSIL